MIEELELLAVARDAELAGDVEVARAMRAQVVVDHKYVRFSHRTRAHRRGAGFRFSTGNSVLSVESIIGAAPLLRIHAGEMPSVEAAAGTVLAETALPPNWMDGAQQHMTATETGTARFFRIYDSQSSDCVFQGPLTMNPSDDIIVAGQDVVITLNVRGE